MEIGIYGTYFFSYPKVFSHFPPSSFIPTLSPSTLPPLFVFRSRQPFHRDQPATEYQVLEKLGKYKKKKKILT